MIRGSAMSNGAHDAALKHTAERRMVTPLLQISRLEQIGDQPQKALIVETLAEDRQQDWMVQAVEAARDIARDEPFHPFPVIADLSQGGVTAPARAEAVRVSWAPCRACDLYCHASPSRGIPTSLRGVLRASAALLIPITCLSPSPRQHLRELSSRPWLLGESLSSPVCG